MTDWLFSSGDCIDRQAFGEAERLLFCSGATSAYLDEIPILPGVWMYRSEAASRIQFELSVDGGEPGRGRVILGTVLASRGVVNLEGCDDQSWRDDGRYYVVTPVERRTSYEVDAENGWRLVALRLEQEALDVLAGDEGLPVTLRQALEGRIDDFTGSAPLPGAIRSIGHALLRSPFEGPMQILFRQAKVLELLAHQIVVFDGVREVQVLNPAELTKVRMARDRLLADLRNVPTLDDLALSVGMSSKRLNRGFRDLYGMTVFAYLHDARLDAARAALEADTPLALKHLAWELGYQQVTNFVTAFRRRFGVTPGAYRAGRKGDYEGRI